MSFGGYIAYTVRGYKCIPFGSTETRQIIASVESTFDLPASINLRPGRLCLRRQKIAVQGEFRASYSAIVGVSEPNTTRPGSFLAFGVVAPSELACEGYELGQKLIRLLYELASTTTSAHRFSQEPDAQYIRDFISRRANDIQEIERTFKTTSIVRSDTPRLPLLLLCDSKIDLASAFNVICDQNLISRSLYLLDESAKDEIQLSSTDYETEKWPPPPKPPVATRLIQSNFPADFSEDASKNSMGSTPRIASYEQSRSKNQTDQTLELLDDLRDQQYAILKRQRAQQLINYIGLGVVTIFASVAMMLSIISYQGLAAVAKTSDVAFTRLDDAENKLKALVAVAVKSGSRNSETVAVATTQSKQTVPSVSSTPKVTITAKSNRLKIQKTHCKEWVDSSDKFVAEFNSLNNSIAPTDLVPANVVVNLPQACTKIN